MLLVCYLFHQSALGLGWVEGRGELRTAMLMYSSFMDLRLQNFKFSFPLQAGFNVWAYLKVVTNEYGLKASAICSQFFVFCFVFLMSV